MGNMVISSETNRCSSGARAIDPQEMDLTRSSRKPRLPQLVLCRPTIVNPRALRTLAPGNYTAIVRGALDITGVGLVEVYHLQ